MSSTLVRSLTFAGLGRILPAWTDSMTRIMSCQWVSNSGQSMDVGLYLLQQEIDTATRVRKAVFQMCGVFA